MQQATIDQARRHHFGAGRACVLAAANYRAHALVQSGTGTVHAAQQTQSGLQSKHAALAHNQSELKAAAGRLDVLKTQHAQAGATSEHNQAPLEQARLNLGYTTITSPIDGAVGRRFVQFATNSRSLSASSLVLSRLPLGTAGKMVVRVSYAEWSPDGLLHHVVI